LFTAAHALLKNNVRDELTILGTLAFAWSRGARALDPEDYGGLELLSSANSVPLLRLPRITAGVITYDGSRIPKAARIDVFSRDVKPQELAENYEALLKEHGIHTDECSGGSVHWNAEAGKLTMTVRAMKELAAWRMPFFTSYPAGRIYAFPPPSLVRGFYGTLLGSTHKSTLSGYAYGLAESGGHTPYKAVTGCVAWLLGEGNHATIPQEEHTRIRKALNKHLLVPRDERELVAGDTVWRDASSLRPRLMRNLYHLQEGLQQYFSETTV